MKEYMRVELPMNEKLEYNMAESIVRDEYVVLGSGERLPLPMSVPPMYGRDVSFDKLNSLAEEGWEILEILPVNLGGPSYTIQQSYRAILVRDRPGK